jgi:hypothetical protein
LLGFAFIEHAARWRMTAPSVPTLTLKRNLARRQRHRLDAWHKHLASHAVREAHRFAFQAFHCSISSGSKA